MLASCASANIIMALWHAFPKLLDLCKCTQIMKIEIVLQEFRKSHFNLGISYHFLKTVRLTYFIFISFIMCLESPLRVRGHAGGGGGYGGGGGGGRY